MAEELVDITSPFVAKDERGRCILIYMPEYFSDRAVRETTVGLERLRSTLGIKAPRADTRHRHLDKDELDDTYGPHGFGTLHCAAWFERGNPTRGPVLSREMCQGSRRLDVTSHFVQANRVTKEELSLLYAAGDPTGWRRSVDSFRKLQRYKPATVVLKTSPTDPWSSIALNANLPTHIHRDLSDAKRGLSGLCCFGTFTQGWLALVNLGIKLRFRVGDAILLNTSFIPHYVVDWNISTSPVSRFSMSFFNHQDVLD